MSITATGQHDSYIGDGVYVHFDGYHIVLRTEREDGIHWIALEPAVLRDLIAYQKRIYAQERP